MKTDPKTTKWQYFDALTDLGLGADEAKLYEYLLKNGPQKASTAAKKVGLSRVLGYRALGKLVDRGVITREDPDGGVAVFTANHPSTLSRVLEQQKQRVTQAELELRNVLGGMASDYNLLSGKPNVQFLEGVDGVQKILDDTLLSDGEVLTYLDIEMVEKYFKNVNDKYVAKRAGKGIKKRILVIDNEFARNHFQKRCSSDPGFSLVTNLKMVKTPIMDIEGAVQIYDGKVGLITVSNQNLISVIIEDARIYKLFQSMFEAIYLISDDFTC